MSRKLTSRSSVENLKREAKRWLKALRDDSPDARAKFAAVHPTPPATPTLRDVQHALALEYGYDGWASLTAAVASAAAAVPADESLIAILTAAQENDLARLATLLDAHPSLIDARGTLRGHTGLRTAMHFGNHHYDVVKLLLDRGADPNIRDEGDNAYPLHFVAERLELRTAQLLVEHGADPVGEGDMHQLGVIGWATCFNPVYLGITPDERIERRAALADYLLAHGGRHNVFSATAMDETDVIRRIVGQEPDQLERLMDDANRRRHPLHLAVVERRHASLATLLDLGADVEARDVAGFTALDQAALIGDGEAADLLIARGARLELPAALALDRDVERILSENPRDIVPGGRWATLIIRAAEQSGTRMLETLIRHGADVNTTDNATTAVDSTVGYTALHAAAFHGNQAAVDILLAHGADVTARESRYQGTPAGWAAYAKHDDIAEQILAGPIDMFQAIEYKRAARLREIFDRDPGSLSARMPRPTSGDSTTNTERKAQWTPLGLAVANGYAEGVRELLALGAEATCADPDGRTLREIATEQGYTEIIALLDGHEHETTAPVQIRGAESRDALVARFLSNACPDHHVRGGPSHIVARQTANSLLAQYPDLATDSIYTAVVCGELAAVDAILAHDPDAARRLGGPKGSAEAQGERFIIEATGAAHPRWEPLLYLCFSRIDSPPARDDAVVIARRLLDHGADPNAYFMAGSSRYSPLTGLFGGGEEGRGPHPHRDDLARMLLEGGANPYDVQVFYNVSFNGGLLHYLELIYDETLKAGRGADWNDPEWPMIDMGGYGKGARYVLGQAVQHDDRALAEWSLSHGANPNTSGRFNASKRAPRSLYVAAKEQGLGEMAELLARHGATMTDVVVDDENAFVDACLRLDHSAARALLARNPSLVRSPKALHVAAALDRADAVSFVLDVGVPVNVVNPTNGQVALHDAAWGDASQAIEVLVSHGGDVDRYDAIHGGTPLGFAIYGQKWKAVDVLRRYGNDVWNLALSGSVERLRAALDANPKLARAAWPDEEITALMRLPGDPTTALAVARVLVEHGADPRHRNAEGLTAIDLAEQRGLIDVARFLQS